MSYWNNINTTKLMKFSLMHKNTPHFFDVFVSKMAKNKIVCYLCTMKLKYSNNIKL